MPLAVAGVIVVALAAWNLAHLPPSPAEDGGFPAAAEAATRIEAATTERAIAIRSLPRFKSADTFVYPLARDGVRVVPEASTRHARDRVRCAVRGVDRRRVRRSRRNGAAGVRPFSRTGRPAPPGTLEMRDRFEAAPGRLVSVYVAP